MRPTFALLVLVLAIGFTSCGGSDGTNSNLISLTLSSGTMAPPFEPSVTVYDVAVGAAVSSLQVTPTPCDPGSTILVNGAPVAAGNPSSPIPLTAGSNVVTVRVTAPRPDCVTVYTLDVTRGACPPGVPPAPEAYIKASNTEAGDGFGVVALSGDTLVVGASLEDSGATGVGGNEADNSVPESGAAYVFVRTGSTWTQQAYLKASNPDVRDFFGTSVAISGDTLVVGAFGESSNASGVNGDQSDDSAFQSGAAYVFVRTGTTWTQQAYLKASDSDAGDQFSGGLAIDGDTIVVGAVNEASAATGVNGDDSDDSAPFAGAAYVFVRTGTTWTQQAYLKASNTDAGDVFGVQVAIDGDTVVVGALQESSSATGVNGNEADDSLPESGAAYLFVRTGTTWTQQAYLKASNTDALDSFGSDVTVSGDTVVVGARREDGGATGVNGDAADDSSVNAGAAYAFVRSGTTWTQQAYLKASNTDPLNPGPFGDIFGEAVEVSGDLVVVGAQSEASNATGVNGNEADNSAPNAGAAYLFARCGGAWTQLAYLKAFNTEANDFLGSVSISGDTVVLGAVGESSGATGVGGDPSDNSAPNAGAVYVYR